MSKLETGFFVLTCSFLLAAWYHDVQFSALAVLIWVIASWISAFLNARIRQKVAELLHAISEAKEITITENGETTNVLKQQDDGQGETRADP